MKKPIPPCLKCEDRVVEDPDHGGRNCHDYCEKYIEFRKAMDEYNKEIARLKGETKIPDRRPWMAKFQKKTQRIREGGEVVERVDIEYTGAKAKTTRHS